MHFRSIGRPPRVLASPWNTCHLCARCKREARSRQLSCCRYSCHYHARAIYAPVRVRGRHFTVLISVGSYELAATLRASKPEKSPPPSAQNQSIAELRSTSAASAHLGPKCVGLKSSIYPLEWVQSVTLARLSAKCIGGHWPLCLLGSVRIGPVQTTNRCCTRSIRPAKRPEPT